MPKASALDRYRSRGRSRLWLVRCQPKYSAVTSHNMIEILAPARDTAVLRSMMSLLPERWPPMLFVE